MNPKQVGFGYSKKMIYNSLRWWPTLTF